LPADRPLELMDVAVSTAITTLEWSEQLTGAGIDHRLLAGDSHLDAAWLALPGSDLLLDRDRSHLLLAVVAGRPVDVAGGSWRSGLAVPVLKAAARVAKALHVPMRRVELVSPRIRDCEAVTVVEDDIFVTPAGLRGR